MNGLQITLLTILAITVFAALVWLLYIKRFPRARAIALQLVIDAEARWGSGTGDIKYVEVSGLVYNMLPGIVRLLITEKGIDNLIEAAVKEMKNSLSEEKIRSVATS